MALDTLTSEQRDVVCADDKHLVVLAGPGSGKTHVIIEKIWHLFSTGRIAEPYGLLAITFTNAAANEMRSRLRRKGFIHWDRVWIGTFHKFGMYLLGCYGGDVGVREDFDIIDLEDMKELAQESIQSSNLCQLSPSDFLQRIEFLKRQGIYPSRRDQSLPHDLRTAYEQYQQALAERNLVDFGDLLALTVRLLRESALARRLFTNYFQYVIVDEFQDTDSQQLELTCLVAESAAVGSTMVADDDQSIYKFRGAKRANVYAIEERLHARRIVLGANFRSDQVIVEAAQAIITHDQNRRPKDVVSYSHDRGELYRVEYSDVEEEGEQVAATIYGLAEQYGVEDWGQVAVITRARWRADQILQGLNTYQVPWFDRARLRFQESWETSLGLATLVLAVDPNSSEGIHRLMTAVEDGGLAFVLGDEDALDTALNIRERLITHSKSRPRTQDVNSLLQIGGLYEIIHRTARSTGDTGRITQNLHLLETDIQRESHESGLRLEQIVDRLAGYGAVQVLSGHGSKGREFDYVFLAGLEDDVLPSYRSHQDPDEIDEERRIFYVSLTRTKKAAFLSSVRQRMMPWGKMRSCKPSRFVAHIPTDLFSS